MITAMWCRVRAESTPWEPHNSSLPYAAPKHPPPALPHARPNKLSAWLKHYVRRRHSTACIHPPIPKYVHPSIYPYILSRPVGTISISPGIRTNNPISGPAWYIHSAIAFKGSISYYSRIYPYIHTYKHTYIHLFGRHTFKTAKVSIASRASSGLPTTNRRSQRLQNARRGIVEVPEHIVAGSRAYWSVPTTRAMPYPKHMYVHTCTTYVSHIWLNALRMRAFGSRSCWNQPRVKL